MSEANITAHDFLDAIYGERDGGLLVTWRAEPTKKTEWWTGLPPANWQPVPDVYFGLGLQANKTAGRGLQDTVVAIPGMWADVDLAGKVDAKHNYPPRKLAEQALTQMPLSPSCVVESGAGLHVYWLLHELLPVSDKPLGRESSRAVAKESARRWQALLADRLKRLGDYDLDHTHDLSRVLRVPGSIHSGTGNVVRMAEGFENPDQWGRYEWADFEPFLTERTDAPASGSAAVKEYKCGNLVLREDANPPVEKLMALEFNSPEFARVWKHKKDFPSNSEREMSLASYAVEALWSDQEIVDLIIAHRRIYAPGRVSRVLTDSYMTNTIGKVRGDVTRDDALRSVNNVPASLPKESKKPEAKPANILGMTKSESDRQVALDHLSSIFGVEVDGWTQTGKEDATYTLHLADGAEIEIGAVANVSRSCLAIRDAIYSETGHMMKVISKTAWPGVCEALAKICVVDESEITRRVQVIREDLSTYMAKQDCCGDGQRDEACATNAPLIESGVLSFRPSRFLRHLNLFGGDGTKWEGKKLGRVLRKLGGEGKRINFHREDGGRSSQWRWFVPITEISEKSTTEKT